MQLNSYTESELTGLDRIVPQAPFSLQGPRDKTTYSVETLYNTPLGTKILRGVLISGASGIFPVGVVTYVTRLRWGSGNKTRS